MSSVASLKVVKSFSYRGGTKLWSNRYHFDGTTPPDSTHWTTLSDAVVLAEKAALADFVTIVETLGYAAGSDVPIFTKTYTTAGTLTSSGFPRSTGDSAVLVRYSTNARTSKNHPLYLFNYYHGAMAQAISNGDVLDTTQITNMGTYASAWITGFSDGAVTHHRAGPNGDLATGQLVSSQIHHRDFPR